MNIWELEIPDQAQSLLSVVLKPEMLKTCVYAICVDLSQPWNIMKSLNKWMETLKTVHKQVCAVYMPFVRACRSVYIVYICYTVQICASQ